MLTQNVRSTQTTENRRSKPRIDVPFHVKVDGVDQSGERFTIETVVDNVSGNGVYLRMIPCVDLGARLSITLGLNTPSAVIDEAPCFLMDAVVLRRETKTGGVCGVAAIFDRVRFL